MCVTTLHCSNASIITKEVSQADADLNKFWAFGTTYEVLFIFANSYAIAI